MENNAESNLVDTEINTPVENLSFENFWEEDLKNQTNSGDISLSTVQASIAAATKISIIPIAATLFGIADTQTKVDKFSKEVSKYATSKELISSVSKEIGEPQQTETEEEFIERASNTLRNFLKKKFKV